MPWPWDDEEEVAAPEAEEDPGVLGDLLRVASPLVVPILADRQSLEQARGAGGRLLERARRGVPAALEHPLDTLSDTLTGAADMSGIGSIVERLGTPREHTAQSTVEESLIPGLGLGRDLFADDPGRSEALRHGFDALHERQARAQERSPMAYGVGEVGGALLPAAIPVAGEAEALPLASRMVRGAGEATAYGGLTSEGTTPEEVAQDAALSAVAAPVLHGVVEAGGAATRAAGRGLSRFARDADRARIASVLGERRAMLTNADMDELIQTLGGGDVHVAAQRIRDSGVVGTFSTVQDIVEAAQRRLSAAEAQTAAIRGPFESRGHRVPADAVPRAVEGERDRLLADPGLARYAPQLEREAAQMRTDYGRVARPGVDRSAVDAAERGLADLLGQREALGQPQAIAEVGRRLDAAETREGAMAARGEPGATARQAARVRERDAELGDLAERMAAHPDGASPAGRSAVESVLASREGPGPAAVATAERAEPLARTAPGASRASRSPDTLAMWEDLPHDSEVQQLMREDVRAGVEDAYGALVDAHRAPTLSLHEAERGLEPLREASQYRILTDVPAVRRVARRGLRAGRGAIDDVVERELPEVARGGFRAARRDVQASHLMRDMAEERAQRAASRSPLASVVQPVIAGILGGGAEYGRSGSGGGALSAGLAAGVGYRALRAREASLLASGAEGVGRLLQSGGARALGRWGPQLERALASGRLPLVHQVLLRTDPEYRATLEAADPPQEDEQPTERRPFDPAELEEPERRPFDPSELE